MKLLFLPDAWDEYRYWQATDRAIAERLDALLADALRHPFTGLGKPEPLRRNLAGWWSRRITGEHRLVYRCVGSGEEQRLEVAQCRSHY